MTDREANRFSARAARYARVGANVGGVAARMAGARLLGRGPDRMAIAALDGNQPGDPAEGAKTIVACVHSPDPPLRLPLGETAIEGIREKLRAQLAAT